MAANTATDAINRIGFPSEIGWKEPTSRAEPAAMHSGKTGGPSFKNPFQLRVSRTTLKTTG